MSVGIPVLALIILVSVALIVLVSQSSSRRRMSGPHGNSRDRGGDGAIFFDGSSGADCGSGDGGVGGCD